MCRFLQALAPGPIAGMISMFVLGCGSKGTVGSTVPTKQMTSASRVRPVRFQSMAGVVNDSSSTPWFDRRDTIEPFFLHFNGSDGPDTLWIAFTPECWGIFPITLKDDTVCVRWAPTLDTKYDFSIVKAVRRLGGRFRNEPFMQLWLANDTTVGALYPNAPLMAELIKGGGSGTLFPDRFHPEQPIAE